MVFEEDGRRKNEGEKERRGEWEKDEGT